MNSQPTNEALVNSLGQLVTAFGSDKVRAILGQIINDVPSATEITITVSDDVWELQRAIAGQVNEFMTWAEDLQKAKAKGIPAEFLQVLNPNEIAATVDQLDAAVQAVVEKGEAKEATYGEKPQLMKRRTQLETDVKLTEANALMQVQGEGRNQYVVIDGVKSYLGNDQARDAYRRMMSKESREELARINAEINAVDIELQKATDSWYTAKEAADSIRAKANLQAALLNFLATRG